MLNSGKKISAMRDKKNCEETRRFVSIFKNIDAMLLNLDPDIVHSGPRLHSTCSKQHGQFLNRRKENL
jgi:hypothetical protein